MIFRPVHGSRLSQSQADKYGGRIAKLQEKSSDKAITPEEVLEDAKKKSSPLHDFFDWDDMSAASAYRIDQARYLLRSIEIVIVQEDSSEVEVRAFHNVTIVPVKDKEEKKQVYVGVERAMKEEKLRKQVVDRALRELAVWEKKYKVYSELDAIFFAIENVRKKL